MMADRSDVVEEPGCQSGHLVLFLSSLFFKLQTFYSRGQPSQISWPHSENWNYIQANWFSEWPFCHNWIFSKMHIVDIVLQS